MADITGDEDPNNLIDTSGDDTLSGLGNADTISISTGRDVVYGGTGPGTGSGPENDTLIINWAGASQGAYLQIDYGFVDTSGSGFWNQSTWRYEAYQIEHLNATTGSGNDGLRGITNSTDTLNGGAGIDQWFDDFSAFTGGLTVMMAQIAGGSVTIADGSVIANMERASLGLGIGADVFRDFGANDDQIGGNAGNDTLGTSAGRDVFYGGDDIDTVIIDWSSATQNASVEGQSGYGFVDTGGGAYGTSTRRVEFFQTEHINVTMGSGDDHLQGIHNQSDTLNGGAGIDRWLDDFSAFGGALTVNMAAASTQAGITLADGTRVRNVERASLSFGTGNDVFRDAGAFDDIVAGSIGADNLGTTNGRDVFYGQDGDDQVVINWGNATQNASIEGQSGFAFVDTSDGTYGSSSRRVEFFSTEHVNATTGSGNDRLRGVDNQWDLLNGNGGVDYWLDNFSTHTGVLNIDMNLASSAPGLSLADGTRVKNVEHASLVLGLAGDTFRDKGNFDDVIEGRAGDDNLGTTNGRDIFYGQDGANDVVTINWANATQAVTIEGQSAFAFVDTSGHGTYGSSARRVEWQTIEHVSATTGSGNDRLRGVDNQWDIFNGGAGRDHWVDSFSLTTAALTIDMAAAASNAGLALADGTWVRNIERAELILGLGNDVFRDNGNFADTVQGNEGNDQFRTTNGQDFFYGQNGTDTVVVEWGNASQNAFFYGYYGFVDTSGSATFGSSTRRVETQTTERAFVTTGSGNDILHGLAANDRLIAAGGHDQLSGEDGADELNGGSGNDTMNGGAGADEMTGGAGNDTYYVDSAGDKTIETAGQGTDTIVSTVSRTLAANVEALQLLGVANLTGSGNALNNQLLGNGGNNNLQGLDGNDLLEGGDGNDTLNGGAGLDTLAGGSGNDVMVGGSEADLFRLGAGAGADRINGFETALDQFDLDGGLFSARSQTGGNTLLTHAGGTVLIAGVTGLSLAQWNALVLPAGAGMDEHAGWYSGPGRVPHTLAGVFDLF